VTADPSPRFLVDGMLVRLGKYLRCLGFDAEWERGAGSRALVRRARAEERVFLTRNTRLGTEIVPPPRWLALAGEDPVAQVGEVALALGLALEERLFTRCIRCNVALVAARPEEVAARVLAPVRARHRLFFTCPRCSTVFWRGSHVANTCRKLGLEPPRE
jgi:uncharacterized protein with PIN domain